MRARALQTALQEIASLAFVGWAKAQSAVPTRYMLRRKSAWVSLRCTHPTKRQKQIREAERRQAHGSILRASGRGTTPTLPPPGGGGGKGGGRSPVGVPPRLSPCGLSPDGSAPGQASWDAARAHDPEKWKPVFRKDNAPLNS